MVTLEPLAKNRRVQVDRIEILGVFGSGKTTLAHRLAGDKRRVLAESHEQNAFWGDGRASKTLGFLPYDLSFLLQHAHVVARAAGTGMRFCDWSFASDRLWASMRLGHELPAYEAVHRLILKRVGQPLGYLYLKQPVNEIVSRLVERGREQEASFTEQVAFAAQRLEELVGALPMERVLTVGDDVALDAVQAWVIETRRAVSDG